MGYEGKKNGAHPHFLDSSRNYGLLLLQQFSILIREVSESVLSERLKRLYHQQRHRVYP